MVNVCTLSDCASKSISPLKNMSPICSSSPNTNANSTAKTTASLNDDTKVNKIISTDTISSSSNSNNSNNISSVSNSNANTNKHSDSKNVNTGNLNKSGLRFANLSSSEESHSSSSNSSSKSLVEKYIANISPNSTLMNKKAHSQQINASAQFYLEKSFACSVLASTSSSVSSFCSSDSSSPGSSQIFFANTTDTPNRASTIASTGADKEFTLAKSLHLKKMTSSNVNTATASNSTVFKSSIRAKKVKTPNLLLLLLLLNKIAVFFHLKLFWQKAFKYLNPTFKGRLRLA